MRQTEAYVAISVDVKIRASWEWGVATACMAPCFLVGRSELVPWTDIHVLTGHYIIFYLFRLILYLVPLIVDDIESIFVFHFSWHKYTYLQPWIYQLFCSWTFSKPTCIHWQDTYVPLIKIIFGRLCIVRDFVWSRIYRREEVGTGL